MKLLASERIASDAVGTHVPRCQHFKQLNWRGVVFGASS
jgi:hypothetical protein